MTKKILLPIDLAHEDAVTNAAKIAAQFAEISGATVRLITILPQINPLVSSYVPADVQAKVENRAEEALKRFAEDNLPCIVEIGMITSSESVYHEILSDAETRGCDLIIMASHRPELSDYLLGSNAAKVVRHAKCDVYIVRR